MKALNRKGFTLAELLIVMAIVVVLAAVAIPTFGRQLETARETGDMELIRSAYTEAMTIAALDAIDGKMDGANGGTTLPTSPVKYVEVSNSTTSGKYEVELDKLLDTTDKAKIQQTGTNWQYVNDEIMGVEVPAVTHSDTASTGTKFVTFTFDIVAASGSVKLTTITVANAAAA